MSPSLWRFLLSQVLLQNSSTSSMVGGWLTYIFCFLTWVSVPFPGPFLLAPPWLSLYRSSVWCWWFAQAVSLSFLWCWIPQEGWLSRHFPNLLPVSPSPTGCLFSHSFWRLGFSPSGQGGHIDELINFQSSSDLSFYPWCMFWMVSFTRLMTALEWPSFLIFCIWGRSSKGFSFSVLYLCWMLALISETLSLS